MTNVYADTSNIVDGQQADAADVKTPIDALDTALDDYATGDTSRPFSGFIMESDSGADLRVRNYGNGTDLYFGRAGGTGASPTDLTGSGLTIANIMVAGYFGGWPSTATAEIRAVTDGTHTASSRPITWDVYTIATGAATRARALRIKQDRYLLLADSAVTPGTPSGGIHLWSASGELTVKDSAGNTTTLSTHFPLLVDTSERMTDYVIREWNAVTGSYHELDLYGALEALEVLTGKQFIYHADMDDVREDWDASEETKLRERNHEIADAESRGEIPPPRYVKRPLPARHKARIERKQAAGEPASITPTRAEQRDALLARVDAAQTLDDMKAALRDTLALL